MSNQVWTREPEYVRCRGGRVLHIRDFLKSRDRWTLCEMHLWREYSNQSLDGIARDGNPYRVCKECLRVAQQQGWLMEGGQGDE
jgi:uncharacterized protein YjhX (UPF0386 family)